MTNVIHRRVFGSLLGIITGLAYGLVSQLINSMVMPGIPFFQPPFGIMGNIALSILLGAVLGLACSWSENGVAGVLWASLFGSLAIIIATFLTGRRDAEILSQKITALAFLFFPTAAVLSPLLILFRWVINREEIAFIHSVRLGERQPWQRVVLPLLVLVAAGGAGMLSMYNDLGRAVTPQMNQLVQQGLAAQTISELPEPLKTAEIDLFMENRTPSYTLQWDKDDTNRFAIPRPATSEFDQSIVIARFSNGYWLVCMFPAPGAQPRCKDF